MTDDRGARSLDAFSEYLDVLARDDAAGPRGSLDSADAELASSLFAAARAHTPAGARERARGAIGAEQMVHLNGKGRPMNAGTAHSVMALPAAPPRSLQQSPRTLPFASRWIGLAAIVAILLASIYFTLFGHNQAAIPPLLATPTVEVPAGDANWGTHRGNTGRTGATEDVAPSGDLELGWTFTAGDTVGGPVVADGEVYAIQRGAILYALEATTGIQRWAVQLGMPNPDQLEIEFAIPTVAGDFVYTGSYSGVVYSIRRSDGEVEWAFDTGAQISSSLLVTDHEVYVANDSGDLFALDRVSGAEQWSIEGTLSFGRSSPALEGNTLIIGDQYGWLQAIDIEDASIIWRIDLQAGGLITAAVADGVAYVPTSDGSVVALDAATGEERWRFTASGPYAAANLSVRDHVVVVSFINSGTYGLDASAGTQLWTTLSPNFDVVISGQRVLVPRQFQLRQIDLHSGEEIAKQFDMLTLSSSLAIADEQIFAAAGNQLVMYRAAGGGEALAQTATPPSSAPDVAVIDRPINPAVLPPADQRVAFQWATTTNGDNGPIYLEAIAVEVAPDGNLWVNDGLGYIHIFSPVGDLIETWQTGASPTSITFAADGGFYMPEARRSRVSRYDADRNLIARWDTYGEGDGAFIFPQRVEIDEDGTLWVADPYRGDIQHLTADGAYLGKITGEGTAGGHLVAPASIEMGSDGTMYVVDGRKNEVRAFDRDGNEIRSFGQSTETFDGLSDPWDIELGPDGNLYVADQGNSRIVVFSTGGEVVSAWGQFGAGDGEFQKAASIAFDAEGNAYVVDWWGLRLEKFSFSHE